MQYAIHVNSLSSVFQNSTEKSQQTSQLLFGEVCVIKSERENFYYVENHVDKHCGWVDKGAFNLIEKSEYNILKEQRARQVCVPFTEVVLLEDNTILYLPAGSRIRAYNEVLKTFYVNGAKYSMHTRVITAISYGSMDKIESIALSFLNAPFMYGGKSIFGMDKTGFIQLVFSLCGYSLPRNVQEQINAGVSVYSLNQLRVGDVVFISKEGEFLDSFIFLNDDKLIGVKEKVKICNLSEIDDNTNIVTIRRLV